MSTSLLSAGRFVIMLQGRHAGKKAVVLSAHPEGTKDRKYPHVYVLGIEQAPKAITRAMPQEAIVKRTQIRTFVKCVNFNHVMVTRRMVTDATFWKVISANELVASMAEPAKRKEAKEAAAKALRQKYLNGKLQWFFQALHF